MLVVASLEMKGVILKPDFSLNQPPALTAAEDALLKACAGLNELATSRRDQADLGVRKSATAARSAPDCERATQAAQTAMREHPR